MVVTRPDFRRAADLPSICIRRAAGSSPVRDEYAPDVSDARLFSAQYKASTAERPLRGGVIGAPDAQPGREAGIGDDEAVVEQRSCCGRVPKPRRKRMQLAAALDVSISKSTICIVERSDGSVAFETTVPTEPDEIVAALAPFANRLRLVGHERDRWRPGCTASCKSAGCRWCWSRPARSTPIFEPSATRRIKRCAGLGPGGVRRLI